LVGIARDFLWIEVAERTTVAVALPEHDRPAESRLCGFEQQKLEVLAVVVHGKAPFAIVILEHQRIGPVHPPASLGWRAHHSTSPVAVSRRSIVRMIDVDVDTNDDGWMIRTIRIQLSTSGQGDAHD